MRRVLIPTLLMVAACAQENNFSRIVPAPDPTRDTSAEPAPPGEPVADAGDDAEVSPLDTVTLDGTRSYDPDGGDIVAMEWQLVMKPPGSTAELDDPTRPKPSFFADLAGTYSFGLTVQNEAGEWDSTPDQVDIEAIPLDGFYVELSWNAASDLDLHLMQAGSQFYSHQDVSWCNQNPSWGDPGTADDPSLDWDVIDGYGPETITIAAPWDGTYSVNVHYFGKDGLENCGGNCPASTATVSIYLGGVPVATYTQTLQDESDLWYVADIKWPSGQVVEKDILGTTPLKGCL